MSSIIVNNGKGFGDSGVEFLRFFANKNLCQKCDLARYSKGISDLSSIYKGKLQCSDMISENDSMRDTTIMIHEFVLHPKTLYRYFRIYD